MWKYIFSLRTIVLRLKICTKHVCFDIFVFEHVHHNEFMLYSKIILISDIMDRVMSDIPWSIKADLLKLVDPHVPKTFFLWCFLQSLQYIYDLGTAVIQKLQKSSNHDLINCLPSASSSYLIHLDVVAVWGHFTPGRYISTQLDAHS